jgi:hypothetical protein
MADREVVQSTDRTNWRVSPKRRHPARNRKEQPVEWVKARRAHLADAGTIFLTSVRKRPDRAGSQPPGGRPI